MRLQSLDAGSLPVVFVVGASLATLLVSSCGGSSEPAATAPATTSSTPRAESVGAMEPAGSPNPAASTATAPAAEAPVPVALPSDEELFGAPLVIAGKTVPIADIRRALCLGQTGMVEVELAKLQIYIDEEIERRKAAGAKPEDLRVSEEEFQSMKKEVREEIEREFPGGEVNVEDVLADMETGGRNHMILQRLFQKLFLPENPDELPPISTEAIIAKGGGPDVLTHLKEAYEEQKNQENPPARKDPAMKLFADILMQQVIEHLNDTASIVDNAASLPPDVLMRVNGQDITVEEVWKKVKPTINEYDVRCAKQWITNMSLLRTALQEAQVTITDPATGEQRTTSAWLTDEEADASYRAHSDPYKGQMFSMEKIALAIKKFPSVTAYKQFQHVYDSFKRMMAPQMTREVLQKQADFRTSKVLGQVAVDVDVILIAAFDFKTQSWKPDGWEWAKQRATEVARLLEEGRPWNDLMEEHSEFYDPPIPASQRGQDAQVAVFNKGRFRNVQRNNFLPLLGESQYLIFLNGTSITDFIMFQQELNSVEPPMRGPYGYYIPMLLRRSDPLIRKPLAEDAFWQLVEEDYLNWQLNLFTQELLQKNEVFGIDSPQ
jgi:hypothetical protein